MSGFCDLHVHSTRSDGTVVPAEIVRLAKEARLDAVALTDHDTLDGVAEAAEAGARCGIRVVPGVELSLPFGAGPGEPPAGTFHMIVLGGDPGDATLLRVAATLRDGRGPRNAEIVGRLRAHGIEITVDEVRAEAKGDVVARPHIARVLVRKGVVPSLQDAFDVWLAKGRPAYADRARVTLEEAVAAARASGGASIVCHPHTLGFASDDAYAAFLVRCRETGVDALEVRTGRGTKGGERRWEALAARSGLLRSGGSDFHGDVKPDLKIGSGRGRLRVPTAWLEDLLERARSRTATGRT